MSNTWSLFFKANQKVSRLIGCLFISWLLTGCASAPQTATPDVAALSTAAVATVYANLTLSPVSNPTPPPPSPTPLPSAITDKFDVPMVLVPAGPFLMGRDQNAEGQPYVEVTIGDYYIDTYEVTNQRYMICVHAGACEAPDYKGTYTHTSYYEDPAFGNYPVLINKSQMAETYCAWRGAHLPTEIEWEKAMRGPDGRSYPWGNTPPDDTRANLCDRNCYQNWANAAFDDGYTDVAPVGSFPAGASPYGVMDMIGNLNEDVTGVGVAYQAYLGQPAPEEVIIEPRGGSWNTDFSAILKTLDGYSYYSLDGGFRCAGGPVGAPVTPVFRPLNPVPTLTAIFTPTHTPLPSTATATILPATRSSNVYPIAFVGNMVEGKYTSLQVVNDDGSNLRTIFPRRQEPQMEIRQPTWSPDGKSLYFIGFNSLSQQYLYQAEPAETDSDRLYHGVEGLPDLIYEKLALSTDGRYLALVYSPGLGDEAYWGSDRNGAPALGLFDLKTKTWKNLPIPNIQDDGLNTICLSPEAWSRDGRQIAFVSRLNTSSGGKESALFIANLNGTVKKLTRVADDPEPEQCPIWSPSGKQVIFAGQDPTSVPEGEDGFRLMSIRPDGSNSAPLGWVFPGGNGQLFRFSPDGQQLAAVFYNDLERLSVNSAGLFELSEPDQGLEPWLTLSWNLAGASSPAWSPDSRRIAFPCADNLRDDPKICIINADGTSGFALTDAGLAGSKPAWSPDGLKIAFLGSSHAGSLTRPPGLYVMNTDGSGLLRLAADLGLTGGDWDPEAFFWSPQLLAP